jgi:hypothetical protein
LAGAGEQRKNKFCKIPGYKGSGMPIFAKSHGNELWPAIAEKYYAKYHKGYLIIEGGNTGPTMRELTGTPTYMFNFTKC